MPGAELVRIDARFGGEHADEQRLLGHFETEDSDRLAVADRDIVGDVDRKRGFSHRGARGEDDQFRRLEAGSFVVQIGVTGGKAGDALAFA